MARQDLFKNYFRNPNKKFIDSGVICPECDSTENHEWKIDDSSIVDTDGKDTKKLLDLDDISSPIDEFNTSTNIIGPKGNHTIPGLSKGPQNKESSFSLSPDFGNSISDPLIGGIPYNTDIEFDLTLPDSDTPERLRFEADPNREYPILDQINDYFVCMGLPIKASIESKLFDENICAGSSLSDHAKCLDYIKRKKQKLNSKEDNHLPYLVFKSTIVGYDFKVDNISIFQKFLSDKFPTSPYLKEVIDPEGIVKKEIPFNLIFDTVKVEETVKEIATTPLIYKVKLDPVTNDIVSKEVVKTVLDFSTTEKEIKLTETTCLSVPAFKTDLESAVSYAIKIIYPSDVDATKQYIWLRHSPSKKELEDLFEESNIKREKLGLYKQTYLEWYNNWVKTTIDKGYWIPVNTLYIVLGTREKLIPPVLIYNPNTFRIKTEIARHI